MAAAVIPACRKRAAKEKPLCLKDRETSDCLEEERGEGKAQTGRKHLQNKGAKGTKIQQSGKKHYKNIRHRHIYMTNSQCHVTPGNPDQPLHPVRTTDIQNPDGKCPRRGLVFSD